VHPPSVCGSSKGCNNKGGKYTQKKFKIKDLRIFYSSGQTKKEINHMDIVPSTKLYINTII
jgi:hypothetical protein